MDRRFYFVVFLYVFICSLNHGFCQDFRQWSPKQNKMEDLLCNEKCFSKLTNAFDDGCCVCNNDRNWTKVIDLQVEYTNIRSGSNLTLPGMANVTDDSHFRVTHRHEHMLSLPSNICTFPKLVDIDFSHNAIEELTPLHCLDKLDSLRLDYNKLTYISNMTFTGVRNLRVLSLTHNFIRSMDTDAFNIGYERNIIYLNMSYNIMSEVDTSNIMFQQFCEINYNYLPLNHIVNNNDWRPESGKIYGTGGSLNFDNASFTQYFNYSDVGLSSWSEAYSVLNFSISTENTRLVCDCLLGILLNKAFVEKFWKQYSDFICEEPEQYVGIPIRSFFEGSNHSLDMLICNITENCPKFCRCFTRSSRGVLVIDCTNVNLTKIPDDIPYGEGEPYELQFSKNRFLILSKVSYLERVEYINLADCGLNSIPQTFIVSLSDTVRINVTLNKLKNLPRGLQNKDPNIFYIGRYLMDCSCETSWVSDWIQLKKFTENHSEYLCQNFDSGNLNMLNDLSEYLDCSLNTFYFHYIVIGIFAFTIVVLVPYGLIKAFCYPEVYVIYRKKIRRRQLPKRKYNYDAYVSFDDENEVLRKWVYTMVEHFEQKGYRIFLPCRDQLFGKSFEEASIEVMETSRNFIVILSEKFVEEHTVEESNVGNIRRRLEYETSLSLYKHDKSRNLVFINFDNLDSAEVSYRYHKAFINVWEIITFAERMGLLFSNIEKQIRPPQIHDICIKEHVVPKENVLVSSSFSSENPKCAPGNENLTDETKEDSMEAIVQTQVKEKILKPKVNRVVCNRGHECKCVSCKIKRDKNVSKDEYLKYDKMFSSNRKRKGDSHDVRPF